MAFEHLPESDLFTGPAKRAPVRPRARLYPDGEILPLEDHIANLLARPRHLVNLFGPPGSGKTTALQHLAACFDGQHLLLCDNFSLRISQPLCGPHSKLLILTTDAPLERAPVVLELADWTQDDFIEYLLAMHRERCKSVMRRLQESDASLPALPELGAMLLDAMAADETLVDPNAALRRVIERQLPNPEAYAVASAACLDGLLKAEILWRLHSQYFQPRCLRIREVAIPLAAEWFASRILTGDYRTLVRRPSEELLKQTAAVLQQHANELASFNEAVLHDEDLQPAGVSLLLLIDRAWQPANGRLSNLENADLRGAHWPDFDMHLCHVKGADFSGADLTRTIFDFTAPVCAIFRSAQLPRASLRFVNAANVDFTKADLSLADFHCAKLESAVFTRANLHGANLSRAELANAKLDHADLVGAILPRAHLDSTNIEDADFSAADLSGATLVNLNLRDATFTHATFQNARLLRCRLEHLELPSPNFESANLAGSDLTGSTFPHANFKNADLRRTGLADVQWEHADLENADLRNASFHMGSSRSGLVKSEIASEGTRTGFYTDDYNDQDYKAPEEIRKANLRFANLTGAKIEETDFYLVDLRGATYTKEQGAHLARCGAILHARGA